MAGVMHIGDNTVLVQPCSLHALRRPHNPCCTVMPADGWSHAAAHGWQCHGSDDQACVMSANIPADLSVAGASLSTNWWCSGCRGCSSCQGLAPAAASHPSGRLPAAGTPACCVPTASPGAVRDPLPAAAAACAAARGSGLAAGGLHSVLRGVYTGELSCATGGLSAAACCCGLGLPACSSSARCTEDFHHVRMASMWGWLQGGYPHLDLQA